MPSRKRNRKPTPPRRSEVPILLGLWALAFLHRILFLASNVDRSWGFTIFYEGDSETFYNFARSILAGVPYDGGIPFHPPAWPYLLSFIHRLVGAGDLQAAVPHLPVKLWVAALGSTVVPLTYALVRRYLGSSIALVSALGCVYSFGLYVISIAPVSESLYLVLLLLALFLASHLPHALSPGEDRGARTPRDLLLATLTGVVLGLLCLTRAEGALIAFLVVGIGLAGSVRKNRKNLRTWILAGAGVLVVLTPWTVRNHQVLGRVNETFAARMSAPLPTFVPISAYGPLNFALANNAEADGTFSRAVLTSRSESATLDITDPQHLDYFLHGYRIGWRWISDHPGDFLTLVAKRWGLFFDAFTLGFTQWNLPGGLDGIRRPVDLLVPDSRILEWILLALGLGGILLQLRGGGSPRRFGLLTLVVTGAGMLASGLFFGYARLGVLLLPLWFAAVATTVVGAIRITIVRRRTEPVEDSAGPFGWSPSFEGRSRWAWVVPLALLLLIELWGATGDRTYNATGTQLEGASHLNPHAAMRLEVVHRSETPED